MTEQRTAPATGMETDAASELGLGAGASVATALPASKRKNMTNMGMAAIMTLLSETAIFVLSLRVSEFEVSLLFGLFFVCGRDIVKKSSIYS